LECGIRKIGDNRKHKTSKLKIMHFALRFAGPVVHLNFKIKDENPLFQLVGTKSSL
jgi:hypothetical protein